MGTLENAKVPVYLRSIIWDYFCDHVAFAQTPGMIRKEMTYGVPQRSVLRPLIWNITFDDILKEDVPPGVSIIFNDDYTLMVIMEDYIPTLEKKVNTALEAMTCWIESVGLNLVTAKTEVVLFMCHNWFSPLKKEYIGLCTALKYLGLWFNEKVTFKEHAKQTTAKAEKIVASISRFILNVMRLAKSRHKLLTNVIILVLLYGTLTGLTLSMLKNIKEKDDFSPKKGCIKVCQWPSYCHRKGSLFAGRYSHNWVPHWQVQEGIQCYMLNKS